MMTARAPADQMRAWLEAIASGDPDRWDGIAHPEIVMHVPFAPAPLAGDMVGLEACKAGTGQLFSALKSFAFHDIEVFATTDPDLVFATARSEVMTQWNQPYANRYVFQARFRDGLVFDHTEFFNPLPVIEVFGDYMAAA